MKGTAVRISDSQWPLLRVSWPVASNAQAISRHFDEMAGYVERGERMAVVVDLTELRSQTRELRAAAEARLKQLADRAHCPLVCVAFVVRSPIAWAIITAVHWRAPLGVPLRAFTSMAAATRWARMRLDDTPGDGPEPGRDLPRP